MAIGCVCVYGADTDCFFATTTGAANVVSNNKQNCNAVPQLPASRPYLGCWLDQFDDKITRATFVAPKSYALELYNAKQNNYKYLIKSKGFTMDNSTKEDFENFYKLTTGQLSHVTYEQFNIRRNKHFNLFNVNTKKEMHFTSQKRWRDANGGTLTFPFGFVPAGDLQFEAMVQAGHCNHFETFILRDSETAKQIISKLKYKTF